MPKLIIFSCFMLFWAFFQMSGGTDFSPRERVVVSQAPFAQSSQSPVVLDRPVITPQVVTASYVPVETEVLVTTVSVPAVNIPARDAVEEPLAPATTPEKIEEEPTFELRFVAGNRVNLREGPGTGHSVLATLPRGTATAVIATNADGWAQIRLTESGITGWIAERLLSEG